MYVFNDPTSLIKPSNYEENILFITFKYKGRTKC